MDDLAALDGQCIFKTERLQCRKWLPTDIDSIYAVYSDELGSRWVDDGQPITWAECKHWLHVTANNYSRRGYGMFAIEDKATATIVGFCGLIHPDDQLEAEVKYAFLRSHWGLGLASEIVPALLTYGAKRHQLTKIIATVASENLASQQVLKKSGMDLVEVMADESGDPMHVYEWYEGEPH